jgi:glycosyltransferase involved in cell wall biosynthesis
MLKGLYIKTAPFGKGAVGGSITHTFGIINGFVAAGIELTVLTTEEIDSCAGKVVVLPIEYNRTLPPFVRDYIYYRQYRQAILHWIQQHKPHFDFVYSRHMPLCDVSSQVASSKKIFNILEINNTQSDSVWSLVIEPRMMYKCKRKLTRVFYRLAGKILLKWIEKIEIPVIKAADHVVVISEQIKSKLVTRKLIDEKSIMVLPNGVDPAVFRPDNEAGSAVRQRYAIGKDKILVGFAGTFGNWHGIPELTQAIDAIANREDLAFLLMGDGLMRPQMQKQLGKYQNVIFTGLVPYLEMPAHLAACDILIVSNSWDPKYEEPFFGSPTKLFEYMSMGKAIVASRLEQMNDLLSDGKSALMFNPGDVPGMVSAIVRVAGDPALRDKLGRNARELAVQKHTWKKNAQAIISVVNSNIAVTHKRIKELNI